MQGITPTCVILLGYIILGLLHFSSCMQYFVIVDQGGTNCTCFTHSHAVVCEFISFHMNM